MRSTSISTRTPHELLPDIGRVVTRPYMPGGEVGDPEPRAARLVRRVLALPEEQIEARLAGVLRDFGSRHRGLEGILDDSYARIRSHVEAHLDGSVEPSQAARRLVGAYATHEFTIQAAALFNPSMVPAPDQTGAAPGECRFVMSARAVGEGHLSCIEFRTGTLRPGGDIALEEASRFATTGTLEPAQYDRRRFATKLDELGADPLIARRLLDPLPERFAFAQLQSRIARLPDDGVSPAAAYLTVEAALMVAMSNYVVSFPPQSPISERVIFPAGPIESRGMEDARFVRFTDDDGATTYYGTYTAFDGANIVPALLETADFESFRIATLNGPSARNKGMALFPRRVGGQYVALSRYDQENIDLMFSDEVRHWDRRSRLHTPAQSWEFVQIGNCGSPLETEAGWLVLTHGVGPMRTYAIGALLLDRDDPARVTGTLAEPLLVPDAHERDGYVPNVVYSCGGMLHDGRLVLPYGFSDLGIRIALIDLDTLLDQLVA